jgi:hypothetical protein
MTKREPELWSYKETEILSHRDIEGAIDEFFDELDASQEIPLTLEMTGYAPMIPNVDRIANRVLDDLLENYLDDEYPTAGLANEIEMFINEILDWENVSLNRQAFSMAQDIGSLYRVNWREIADSFLSEMKVNN